MCTLLVNDVLGFQLAANEAEKVDRTVRKNAERDGAEGGGSEAADAKRPHVLTEILNRRSANMLRRVNSDTCVVANELAGLILSQVGESQVVAPLLIDNLLSADEGTSDLQIAPVSLYAAPQQPSGSNIELSFWQLMKLCRQNGGQIPVGFRRRRSSGNKWGEWVINPKNKDKIVVFGADDQIILVGPHVKAAVLAGQSGPSWFSSLSRAFVGLLFGNR